MPTPFGAEVIIGDAAPAPAAYGEPVRCAPPLALNPFHAGWAVAAANGRLVRTGAQRWVGQDAARLPVTRAWRLGRLPLPYTAALAHDHCFAGQPDLGDEPIAALERIARDAEGPVLAIARVPSDASAHTALSSYPGARIVQTRTRAWLRSGPGFDDYLAGAVRGKKRKELRRLRARLEEAGDVEEALFREGDDLRAWTDDFLRLEAMGWKGRAGTAMNAREAERRYLALLLESARDAGALRLFRLSLGGRPLAMIIGLMGGDGGLYTYKIAHDPVSGRYSPGVMAMLMVTRHVLGSADVRYADSCAKEGHRMIEQLWCDRRTLHDWIVPCGPGGGAVCALLERFGKARRP